MSQTSEYSIHYEFVANINGHIRTVESVSELSDDTLLAKVKVINKNSREVSRDQFVENNDWMSVKEYYKSVR